MQIIAQEVSTIPGELHLDLLVRVELAPVVGGDRSDRPWMSTHEFDGPLRGVGHVPGSQLSHEQVTGRTLDDRHDAMVVADAHHGVDLPVADRASAFDVRGPLGDVAFSLEPAASFVRSVSFPLLLGSASEVLVEGAALAFVYQKVPVNRFVADREDPGAGQIAGDLLGAPVLPDQRLDQRPLSLSEMSVTPGSGSPAVGELLSLGRSVVPVRRRGVSLELAANSASVPPEGPSNPCRMPSFLSQGRDGVPFFLGDLVIRHEPFPFLPVEDWLSIPDHPFNRGPCCT